MRELSVGSSNDPTAVANDSGPDDYSPRDRSGEGTAIASVIAGNQITGPAVPFSGMAPKAWLGNYRVENSPGMPGGAGQNFESVYVQALNDAFNDGMHIVNLSSGVIAIYGPLDTGSACGQAAGVPCDFLAYNFEKAAQLGMVITVAAGDDGENGYDFFNTGQTGFNLISSPATAPSVIAVGATMNSHVLQPSVSVAGGPSTLQSIPAQTSDAYSADIASGVFSGAWTFPVVDAAQAGNDGFAVRCAAGLRPVQRDRPDPAGQLRLQHQSHQRGQCGSARHYLLHEHVGRRRRRWRPRTLPATSRCSAPS